MPRIISILFVVSFLLATFSGCLSNDEEKHEIVLVVNYAKTNGTILESYIDGERVSAVNVTLEFDFSNTVSSKKLIEFGIETMNEENPVTIDPNIDKTISIEFSNHGVYDITAYAIDEKNMRKEATIIVRINHEIDWTETNTYNPKPLTIDPISENNEKYTASIVINSTIENPVLIANVGGGREVGITWALFDQQEDACQSRKGIVHDGENINWKTIHFNTFETHELRISYDEGQDYIDIYQKILIEYNSVESEPNPK